MKRTLKTILAATAAVTVLGFGAAAMAGGAGFGPGFGHHNGGHHMMFAQGQGPGQGMMMGGPGGNHPRMQQRMMQLDTDGDGAISKAEMQARHDQRFTALDADKNGTVTQEEFLAATPQAFGMGSGPAGNTTDMPEDMKQMMQDRRAFMFRGLDADNSNTLSKDELAAHMEPRFEMMDANNDGRITPDEMGPRGMWGGKRGPAQTPAPGGAPGGGQPAQ